MGRVISTAIQLVDGFSNPSKEVIKNMKKMGIESINTGKQIQRAGKSITDAGSKLTKGITLPVVGMGVAAIKASNDFENAMAKVSTIADTTQKPMTTLKKEVINLSNETGVAVTSIAESQYQAISAGVETASSVNFVRTAVKAAKGGFTDAATAVDGLTTVLNAYNLKADKAATISDQMLVAQNFGKTTFGDMASSMGKVIPIASSLNVSTEELFSSIAVMTKNGIATAESVTGLKAAYSNILKPTADAQKTAQSLGLEFNAAHLKSVGWGKFLQEIKEKTHGDAEAMSKLFGSTEALNGVMVLAGKGSKDFATAMSMMGKSTGATESAYKKMLTPAEKMNISFNKIKNSLLKFGGALAPVFDKVAVIIGNVGDKLNSLSKEQVKTITSIAGVAAAVGPALMIFGKLVTSVGKVHTVIGKMRKSIANFGGIGKMITSPAGKVILVLAAIAAVALIVVKNWDKIKKVAKTVGSAIKKAFVASGVDVNKFKKTFQSMKNSVVAIVNNLRKVFKKIITVLKPVITFVVGTFVKRFKMAFRMISGAVSAFVNGVAGFVKGIMKVFRGLSDFIAGVFCGNWKQAFNGLKTFFSGWGTAIVALVKTPINAIIGIINGAIAGLNKISIKIPKWVPKFGGKEFGVNIPTIPMLYKGTNNWPGGPAMVHDKGGEIIDLPRGSRVYPHDKSVQMAKSDSKKSGDVKVIINKLADKIEVRNESDIDKIAEKLANRLVKVALNMGRE